MAIKGDCEMGERQADCQSKERQLGGKFDMDIKVLNPLYAQ